MGLEVSSYISGLTASWPTAGEPKSQGDDHLRLIKGALQGTFPNATGPMYFPKTEAISGALVLDVTDQNNIITVTTTAGDVTVTLPAGFTTTNAGWSCEVVKVSSDVNAAMVAAASGTITSRVGATATIRVGAFAEPCRFLWTGATWIAVKPGPLVGSTFTWDGSTIPYGCLQLDGTGFSSTNFAELYLALGSVATLKDKRGRTEIGSGTGSGLTNRVLGTTYGVESFQLVTANLPAYTPSGSISGSVSVAAGGAITGAATFVVTPGAGQPLPNGTAATPTGTFSGTFSGTAQGGTSTAIQQLQPSIAAMKLIRAC